MATPTTLERLRILDAVASAGSIAGAARTLHYTPSAVSQHLSTLEREAGTPLGERSNRGVQLTSAGQLLATRSGSILDAVRIAFDDVGAAGEARESLLVIAAFQTAITQLLLPLRDRLLPVAELSLIEAESSQALDLVESREVDGAIVDAYAHQLQPQRRTCDRTLLRIEPIHLVTRPDQLQATFEAHSLAGWIFPSETNPIGHALRALCDSAGFVPQVVAQTDDHRTTFDVVRSCGAVALLPQLALADLPDDLVIAHDIVLPIERRIEFVTRPAMTSSRAVIHLRELLSE